MINKRSRNMMY